MEETHWASMGGRAWSFHTPSRHVTLPAPQCVSEPGRSLNHCCWVFTELNLQCPPPLPRGQWVGWKVPAL